MHPSPQAQARHANGDGHSRIRVVVTACTSGDAPRASSGTREHQGAQAVRRAGCKALNGKASKRQGERLCRAACSRRCGRHDSRSRSAGRATTSTTQQASLSKHDSNCRTPKDRATGRRRHRGSVLVAAIGRSFPGRWRSIPRGRSDAQAFEPRRGRWSVAGPPDRQVRPEHKGNRNDRDRSRAGWTA